VSGTVALRISNILWVLNMRYLKTVFMIHNENKFKYNVLSPKGN